MLHTFRYKHEAKEYIINKKIKFKTNTSTPYELIKFLPLDVFCVDYDFFTFENLSKYKSFHMISGAFTNDSNNNKMVLCYDGMFVTDLRLMNYEMLYYYFEELETNNIKLRFFDIMKQSKKTQKGKIKNEIL